MLSWNSSCFNVILLSIQPELKNQLAAFESFNLIHFHFFSIAWMINYIPLDIKGIQGAVGAPNAASASTCTFGILLVLELAL